MGAWAREGNEIEKELFPRESFSGSIMGKQINL